MSTMSTQHAFAVLMIWVMDSIPWVRCASGNVLTKCDISSASEVTSKFIQNNSTWWLLHQIKQVSLQIFPKVLLKSNKKRWIMQPTWSCLTISSESLLAKYLSLSAGSSLIWISWVTHSAVDDDFIWIFIIREIYGSGA